MRLEAWQQQAEAINCVPADGQTADWSRNGSESMCLETQNRECCEHGSQKADSGCLGELPACACLLLGDQEPEAWQVRRKRAQKPREATPKFPYMN